MMRTHRRMGFFIFWIGLCCGSATAHSKELVGRIGLGYNGEFVSTSQTHGVPAVSIKYGLAPRAMIELVGGFYSGAVGSGVAALKYLQTIYAESYANFYFLLGGGYVAALQTTGMEFLGGLGTEFFIPGVDSVGLSFEAGMAAENLTTGTGSFVVKTFGMSFIDVGMHFYF